MVLFSFVFWEELKTPKRHFEIKRLLVRTFFPAMSYDRITVQHEEVEVRGFRFRCKGKDEFKIPMSVSQAFQANQVNKLISENHWTV